MCAGEFVFSGATDSPPFTRGAFVGDMPCAPPPPPPTSPPPPAPRRSLLYGRPLKTTLVATEEGSCFYITKRALLKFFDDNPGVLVYFQNRRFVE